MSNTPSGKGIGQKTVQDLARWADSMGLPPYEALQLLQSVEADALARQNRAKDRPSLIDPDPWVDSNAPGIELPPLNISAKVKNALFDFINLVDAFRTMLDDKNVTLTGLFDYVMKQTGYEENLKADGSQDGEERALNVGQLREVTKEYADLPAGLALDEFLQNVALVSDIDQFEDKKDAATLITMHAAKGLEFPVVFVVGFEERILPHSRAVDSGSITELEEERRLAYVGITRAKKLLYIVYAFRRSLYGNTTPSKASRFLADIPTDLVKGKGKNAVGMAQQALGGQFARGVAGAGVGSTGGMGRNAMGGASYGATAAQVRAKAAQETVRGLANAASPNKKPEKPKTSATTQFKAGDNVQHTTFGEGVVETSQAVPGDEVVTVNYRGWHKEVVRQLRQIGQNMARYDRQAAICFAE